MINTKLKLYLVLILSVVATHTFAQTALTSKLDISIQNEPLKVFLSAIEAKTDFTFMLDQTVDQTQRVTLNEKQATLQTILNTAFSGKNLRYEIVGRQIILKASAPQQSIQSKNVTGVITDERGEAIIGANVVEKGTVNGNITNMDGTFSINVADNAILQVTYIGYMPLEIAVAGKSRLSIILKEDSKAIDEVVVVGYGVQKKVNLTGAVTQVTFDKEIANRPITNASQALSGKVPGLWVSQNSGKPGSDEAQLRIRGWGTLNNSAPLVIVDGIEGSFSQVNPNDIQSITVLKDAASSAIYGSKAANGVILITTKMAEFGEQTHINLSSYFGVQSLGRRFDLITNSVEHMQMCNEALGNVGTSPLFPDNLITAFENGNDKFKFPNTDWFETLFKNSLIQEHNLSIRSGTQKSSSYLSVNYLNQDGIIPNSQSYNYGIRANLEYDVSTWLKIGGRFNYIRKVADEPYDIGLMLGQSIAGAAPFIAPYTRDGRFGSVEAISNNGTLLYDNRNPLIDANNGLKKWTNDYLTASVFMEIDFMKDLNLKATYSSSANWGLMDQYNEPLFGYTDSGIETTVLNFNRNGLEIIRRQETSLRNNLYSTLNYTKNVMKKHAVAAILGVQIEDYSWKYLLARRTDAPKPGLTQVNAGTNGIRGEGNMEGLRMFSYFGRLNYAFDNKYLFEANFRADASSRFKKGNRWGYFPGFSAGWRITEEPFMKKNTFFSNLKLRGSWGQLGNQSISGYWPYLTTIQQSNELSYSYNGKFAPGAGITAFVDENITWETTSTLDLGVDMGFLNNKLTIEGGYFYKKTSDIIVQLPIPKILGEISAPFENVGEMENKGVELSINYDNKSMNPDQFGFNIGVNLTYIDNKVTKFRGGKSPDQLYLIREGYSYQTLYGYKVTGIYQTDEEASTHMHANSQKPTAGDLKFQDVNNDGKLGFEDKQELGNTIPKITYGVSTNFSYKNFDLSLLFQGIARSHLYNSNQYTQFNYELLTIPTFWRQAWTPQNTSTSIPILKFNSSWTNSENSFWVHRADFIKLKNIQLGYSLSKQWISRLKLDNVYLYANLQNVFTILTHEGYNGFDPERNSSTDGQQIYPTPRIMSVGININF